MVCSKKRKLIVVSAIFTFIYSLLLALLNIIIFVSRTLGKLANDDTKDTLLESLGANFEFFNDIQVYIDKLREFDNHTYNIFVLANIAFMILGVVGVVLAIKALKSPVKKDGTVTYKHGIGAFIVIFSAVVAIGSFIGSGSEYFQGMMSTVAYVLLALAAIALLFRIFSWFPKKNVFKTTVVIQDKTKQKMTPVVLGVEEKLKKVQQLKDIGAITEAQYNAAVIRLLNSI